jgi:hypothetical protein
MRGQFDGDRHDVGLRLAAELLHRGVPPSSVPSLTDNICSAAGWDGLHHRKSAEDTVRKANAGAHVRRDVPAAIHAALDRVFNVVREPPAKTLEQVQLELEHAIASAPVGLTMIAAACGTGKTQAAMRVAERSTSKVVISVPYNSLAEQVVAELDAPTLRVFGPLSVPGPYNGHECRYHEAATHLAAGGQSVRWELCEGRKQAKCPYFDECGAKDGSDGPRNARVVVGNHGLLSDLNRRAGKRGTLIIDEPPEVIEDIAIHLSDLRTTADALQFFESKYAVVMAPAVDAVTKWCVGAEVGTKQRLEGCFAMAHSLLVDGALEAAGATTVRDAVTLAHDEDTKAPPIERTQVYASRTNPRFAKKLGTASHVLQRIRHAVVDPTVVAQVCATTEGERFVALTGIHPVLAKAMTREGRCVVMAADADLYHDAAERIVQDAIPLHRFAARDGCHVRRVHVVTKAATRRSWLSGRADWRNALAFALSLIEPSAVALIVTWSSLEGQVAEAAPAHQVAHYGALRGLDTWKHLSAVITLGDYWVNPGSVERTGGDDDLEDRARELCAAELEQAHGRLRVVHRAAPATMIHVGWVRPRGWREPVESVKLPVGRPPRPPPDDDLPSLVAAVGGQRAAARVAGVSPRAVAHWLEGTNRPEVATLGVLRAAAREKSSLRGADQTPIGSLYKGFDPQVKQ